MRYDAVIVGGGPAGCAAAIHFVQRGAKILLLDRQPVATFKPGEIIEPSVRPALSALGLHDRFLIDHSILLAGRLTSWDEPAATDMPGVLNPLGHGFLVDRAELENWLFDEVSRAGATVERGAAIARSSRSAALWCIEWTKSGCRNRAEAPLLIEATGRGPGVIGAGQRRGLDRLVALMAYVPAPPDVHDQRLIVEAAEDGWWYGALLPGRRVVLAYMTDRRDLPPTRAGRQDRWHTGLAATEHVRQLVAGVDTDRHLIRGFPAESSMRETLSGPGWVAIGEAAAAYDPLSGQGFVAALAKGTALATLVASSSDLSAATDRYAAAEIDAFARYTRDRSQIYAGPARRFATSFWDRHRQSVNGESPQS